ncbi:MAG: hypothetical protein R2860_05580 [Desulfobacterales bacterium]
MRLFIGKSFIFVGLSLFGIHAMHHANPVLADDPSAKPGDLGGVTVEARRLQDNIDITPAPLPSHLESYKKAGSPFWSGYLKDRAIIDYHGASDLAPTNDDIRRCAGSAPASSLPPWMVFPSRNWAVTGDFIFVDYSIIPMESD